MKYARLGDTGLIVSRLALGSMTFGQLKGKLAPMAKVDQPMADRLVASSIDAGVNFFNSADAYAQGQAEEILGRAIGARRRDVVIATKVGNRTGPAVTDRGLSRRHILMEAEESLRRLGTDWIDVYLFHIFDRHTPLEETLEAAEQLVRSGKVRYVGYSNWPAWMSAKAVGIQNARGYEPFRAAEVYYSLVGREVEHEILPFAEDAGIGVTVWSPLAGGLLSGRYDTDKLDELDPDAGRLGVFNFMPYDRTKAGPILAALRRIAEAASATPAQVALAWLLARRSVTSVIIGANSEAQLRDNLGAADLELPAEAIAELDRLSTPPHSFPGWFTPITRDPAVADAIGE